MADNRESTILDVKLDAGKVAEELNDLITRIAALKSQQKELNDQIKAGNDVDGKYAEQLIRVKDQLSWTEKQAKGLSATTKLLNADTQTYSDSLNGERQKLADMQKAYDQLDKAQRESEGGKAFLAAIKEQHDAVLGLEEETGRMQRNVGNYPKAWASAIPGFDKASAVMGKMGVSMDDLSTKGAKAFSGLGKSALQFGKIMITPPLGIIVAILGAILLAVQKVSEAFKKNDDAMTNLQQAFSVFQPVIDVVNKAFEALAVMISKIILGISNVIAAIGSLIPGYAEAADAAAKLVLAQDALEESERNYTVNSAQRSRDIAKLREEANSTEDLDARKAKLEEAIALETANLEEERAIKAEHLRILEETAKQEADTSDETKNKIAAARAAMYQAEEAYYTGVRKLEKELQAVETQRQKDNQAAIAEAQRRAKERKKAAEDAAKAEAEAEKARQANAEEIAKQAEDFAVSLIQDETAKKIAQRQIQGEREIEALQKRLETEKNLTQESRDQLAELIKGKQEALNVELEKMATDAANKLTEEQVKAEEERARRILEYKAELAEDGSAEELELKKQLLDMQMQQELENTELTEEEKYLIRESFAAKAEELDKQYHDNLVKQAEDARKAYKDALRNTASEASKTFGTMSDLLSKYGEENEDAQAAAKAFGIAQIIADQAISIADTAKAITAAVAGATEAAAAGGPAAPFLLAGYIAAMVGAVMGAVASVATSISSAKSLLSGQDAGKFEGGGVIGGTSYTGDKLIAHVNSGEGIYNGTQANNLLQEIANNPIRGGFDYGAMADAMAYAVAQQPAPVMDYQEFTDFQAKVSTYNEFAKL